MPSDRVPSYRRHKASGQAIVTLPDGLGGRKDVLLGKWRSKESRQEYARVIGEWEAAGRRLPRSLADAANDITVAELILLFWPWAEQHYRHADGTSTGELKDWKLSLKPLREMYGHTQAADFGPLALKALREKMITQPITKRVKVTDLASGKTTWQQKIIRIGLWRGVINQRVARIRRMFRWAVENELVPSSVVHGLEAVKGLERGRSAARETTPVSPVAVGFVQATLPYLLPTVADMVVVQLATGMRSGEVCVMRACDIDMTGPVWLYRPQHHKTTHHGHHRLVALGPRAQEIIRRRLKTETEAYLFSPADAVAEKRERGRRERKTKIYPCEVQRMAAKRRSKPTGRAGNKYTTSAYAIAIRRACVRARIPHWHPHQLRHTKATEIRREAGLDAARAVLGHRSPVITEVYAELDMRKAVEVAAKLG